MGLLHTGVPVAWWHTSLRACLRAYLLQAISGAWSGLVLDMVEYKSTSKLRSTEEQLETFLGALGAPVTAVPFNAIARDPRGEATAIARALGIAADALPEVAPPALERTYSPQHAAIACRLRELVA